MKKIISSLVGRAKISGVDKHIDTATRAASAVAKQMQTAGSDVLDSVTRQKIDDTVKEHILLQSRYNDVLAIKLNEALTRIELLEKKISS